MIRSSIATRKASPSQFIASLCLTLAFAAGLAAAPAASSAPAASPVAPTPVYTVETLELAAPGCKQNCDSLEISYPRLLKGPDAAALARVNQAVQQALVQGLSLGEASPPNLRAGVEQFFSDARAARKEYAEMAAWSLMLSIEPEHYGTRLISLRVDQYTFTGGAHGSPYAYFLNYDLSSGQPVTLEQVLRPGAYQKLVKLAEERFRSDKEIPANTGLQEAGYDFENDNFVLPKVFGFGPHGLIFYYNVYEIAAYVSGPTELEIDYYSLSDLIKPEYLRSLAPNVAE